MNEPLRTSAWEATIEAALAEFCNSNESPLYSKSTGMAGSIISVILVVGFVPLFVQTRLSSYRVLISFKGSAFSLHSPSAGGAEVFVFVTLTLALNGNSIRHPPPPPPPPPFLPQLYFPTQTTLHFGAFFSEMISIKCFAFFCRAVKAHEGENFH